MSDIDEGLSSRCAIWTGRMKHGVKVPRVLVVDDYHDTADAICLILSISGFDADVAYGGLAAIGLAQRRHPEVVLLDIWMPDLSGLDVAKRLRQEEATSETILIAHSAAAGETEREQAKQAGFDAFCAKPSDAERLGAMLRYFVRP